jgi:hypothetical protein
MFFRLLVFFSVTFITLSNLLAQNELNVIKDNWLEYSDAPNSLYHYLSDEAFRHPANGNKGSNSSGINFRRQPVRSPKRPR